MLEGQVWRRGGRSRCGGGGRCPFPVRVQDWMRVPLYSWMQGGGLYLPPASNAPFVHISQPLRQFTSLNLCAIPHRLLPPQIHHPVYSHLSTLAPIHTSPHLLLLLPPQIRRMERQLQDAKDVQEERVRGEAGRADVLKHEVSQLRGLASSMQVCGGEGRRGGVGRHAGANISCHQDTSCRFIGKVGGAFPRERLHPFNSSFLSHPHMCGPAPFPGPVPLRASLPPLEHPHMCESCRLTSRDARGQRQGRWRPFRGVEESVGGRQGR